MSRGAFGVGDGLLVAADMQRRYAEVRRAHEQAMREQARDDKFREGAYWESPIDLIEVNGVWRAADDTA